MRTFTETTEIFSRFVREPRGFATHPFRALRKTRESKRTELLAFPDFVNCGCLQFAKYRTRSSKKLCPQTTMNLRTSSTRLYGYSINFGSKRPTAKEERTHKPRQHHHLISGSSQDWKMLRGTTNRPDAWSSRE